jgi:hypothetical protein
MRLKDAHQGYVPEVPVPAGTEIATLAVDDVVVARYCDGTGLPSTLAPRPFLHPVTTLSGTQVTDAQPDDHRWHLGVSVTLQDVGGANVWGGRTYVGGQGYIWRDDHGRQVHTAWRAKDAHGFHEALEWQGPDGRRLLTEERAVTARRAALPTAWVLDLTFTLRNATDRPLSLGSPASNGRPGAGYGGLFWRLPRVRAATVCTSEAEGEESVHGSVAAWVAFSGDETAPFTVVLAARNDATHRDPWFVRVSDYPGLGSQLAADVAVRLEPGEATTRSFRALVADGALSRADIEREVGDTASGGTAPSGTAPSGTAPSGTAPSGTAPGDTAPGDTAPGDTAPGRGAQP